MNKVIVFAIIILFPFFLFSNNNVEIEVNTPSNVEIGKEFIVNVKLNKSNYSGIARLELEFPISVNATQIENSSAIFIKQANTVKFIWINLPKDDVVIVSFKVRVDYFTEENIEVTAKYNYTSNNKLKTVSTINKLKFFKPVNADEAIAKKDDIAKSVVNVKRRIVFELNTKLDKNLVYTVQVAALKSNKNGKRLIKLIDSEFEIKEYIDNGYYKYFFGNFYSLETAIMCKEYCGINGAFVIPYYKGKRITIEESKNISE